MRQILISSTKYNGSIHYKYTAEVIAQTAGELRAITVPGTPFESYRHVNEVTRSYTTRVFWPDRYWNLIVHRAPDGRMENHYVNIATPAKFTDSAVEWIDLDLDLILEPAANEVLLDDEEEFRQHAADWNYPADLVEKCWQTVDEVRGLMHAKAYPFDGSLVPFVGTSVTSIASAGQNVRTA